MSSSRLEERTISGFLSNMAEQGAKFLQDIVGKFTFQEFSLDLRIFSADLLFQLILLIAPVHQPVQRHEGVGQVGAQEIRFGQRRLARISSSPIFHQDARRQQHPG